MLALTAHTIVPGHTGLRWCNVTRPDDEVTEVLTS